MRELADPVADLSDRSNSNGEGDTTREKTFSVGLQHQLLHLLFLLGQKQCSIKNEDELSEVIGNHKTTDWLEFKTEILNRIQKSPLGDGNSNLLRIFDSEYRSRCSVGDLFKKKFNTKQLKEEMNNSNETDLLVNDAKLLNYRIETEGSLNNNCSAIIEEILVTESIKEAVDIRISAVNSKVEVINFHPYRSEELFSSEFSLVADIEVKKSVDDDKNISTDQTYPTDMNLVNGYLNEAKVIDHSDNESEAKQDTNDLNKKLSQKNEPKKEKNTDSSEKNNCGEVDMKYSESKKQAKSKTLPKLLIKETIKTEQPSVYVAENKIVQEIKEMKQREEDLRKTREIIATELSTKCVKDNNFQVNNSKKDKEKLQKEKEFIGKKTECSKTIFINGTQEYNIASVFGSKRKDSFITKYSQEKNASLTFHETPIQREVRIVKQREEELKREREIALKIKAQLEFYQQNGGNDTLHSISSVSQCNDSSCDSRMKFTSSENNSERSFSPIIINCNSSTGESISSIDSAFQSEKFEKSSFEHLIPSPSFDSSICSKLNFSINSQKRESSKKNVNMEKFIASKGKNITFKNALSANRIENPDYVEIKPPQIKNGDQLSHRKVVSVASKIQEELQEMKEREDELKKERISLLGLNGQISDYTKEVDSEDISQNSDFLENTSAISDLENIKEESVRNHFRRRSTLIDKWEELIQKS